MMVVVSLLLSQVHRGGGGRCCSTCSSFFVAVASVIRRMMQDFEDVHLVCDDDVGVGGRGDRDVAIITIVVFLQLVDQMDLVGDIACSFFLLSRSF